jgi:hypothetical protein
MRSYVSVSRQEPFLLLLYPQLVMPLHSWNVHTSVWEPGDRAWTKLGNYSRTLVHSIAISYQQNWEYGNKILMQNVEIKLGSKFGRTSWAKIS